MNVYQLMRTEGGVRGVGGGKIYEKKTNSCALYLFWIALLFYMLSEWMAFKEVYSYTPTQLLHIQYSQQKDASFRERHIPVTEGGIAGKGEPFHATP